ncbi:MAG: gfo/Idh/MocA family oxidoreductase, partial [Chloroflexota bacterium]
GLHALTGVLGPAKRVTALSGVAIKEREFRGETFVSDCDDNTLILVDFGNTLYAFVYGTATGNLVPAFGSPTYFGTKGTIAGEKLNGQQIDYPGAGTDGNALLPHYNEQHSTEEFHVFEGIMQLVDWIRDGTPT